MSEYTAGTLVRSEATFAGVSGIRLNPGSVTVQWAVAGAEPTELVPVNTAPGVYVADVDTTGLDGLVVLQWSGTSPVQAVAVDTFTVVPAAFPAAVG